MYFWSLVEKKPYHFSKRALRAGTALNKWLKKALQERIHLACAVRMHGIFFKDIRGVATVYFLYFYIF